MPPSYFLICFKRNNRNWTMKPFWGLGWFWSSIFRGRHDISTSTYLTRYIATLGDPHHSRNVFTHYILEAMQLVIYKSWDTHTLYMSLVESVLKKKLCTLGSSSSISVEQNLFEFLSQIRSLAPNSKRNFTINKLIGLKAYHMID